MPSEIVKNENDINVETKENTEQFDTKSMKNENSSQEIKMEDKVLLNDESKDLKFSEELSEEENKENQEPIIKDVELQKKQAEELFIDGKRNFIIKDFQAAVNVLSEACNLFGTVYGEMAEECAEAYFMYGCALLELSKVEINPVGLEEKDDDETENLSVEEETLTETDKNNIIKEGKKSLTSDDTNEVEEKLTKNENKTNIVLTEIEEKVDKAEEKSIILEDKLIEKKEKSDDLEDENGKNLDELNVKVIEKEEKSDELGKKSDELEEKSDELENKSFDKEEEMSVDEEEKPDEEIGDDVNDLQLAWEMLDLAKVIYKNKDTEESKLKLAEVLMKCGEVSIEDEKFETAIEDMTESLQIRRLLLPEDSRVIAETLFQLGIAQELGGSGDLAVKFLTEATAVLNQRIKTLEDLTDKNDEALEEMAEVKAVIPEIQERIIDIKERKKAAVSALLAAVCANNVSTENGGSSSTTTQATNISHLVRKRPKQDETDGTPNKVPKLDEESTVTKQ